MHQAGLAEGTAPERRGGSKSPWSAEPACSFYIWKNRGLMASSPGQNLGSSPRSILTVPGPLPPYF